MIEVAIFKNLQRSFIHTLDIIDHLPKHAFEAGWRGEASSIEPSLFEINIRKNFLKVQALSLVMVYTESPIIIFTLLFNNFVHEPFKSVHLFVLVSRKHVVIMLGDFKHYCGDRIPPVFK